VVTAALYARVALIFVLAVLPWTIRNFYAVDSWIFVKSNFGLELWIGNHPGSDAQALHPMYSFPERIRLIMEGEPNYSRDKERAAVGYIKAHPGEFARKTWGRILDTWTANQNSWVDGWIAALQLSREDVWVCSAFSVLSLAGLLLALRNYGMESLPLVICLIVFPIPYYITNTTLRYRHPIDPLMTILAAYAISRLWAALAPRPAMQSLQTISAEK
jgi:hypothetical protein